ncbi:hypothetical protein FDECE_11085 [Fusarium decemcellulare]|nr:hypothetical protein FDECE_11085 [Fusarium decemcellulare]
MYSLRRLRKRIRRKTESRSKRQRYQEEACAQTRPKDHDLPGLLEENWETTISRVLGILKSTEDSFGNENQTGKSSDIGFCDINQRVYENMESINSMHDIISPPKWNLESSQYRPGLPEDGSESAHERSNFSLLPADDTISSRESGVGSRAFPECVDVQIELQIPLDSGAGTVPESSHLVSCSIKGYFVLASSYSPRLSRPNIGRGLMYQRQDLRRSMVHGVFAEPS